MATTGPLPTVIGPTENALRALLVKTLSTTRIDGYDAWVVLNGASSAGPTATGTSWRYSVADALKLEPAAVEQVLADLHVAGLVLQDGSVTALGADELAAARSAVATATAGLVEDISVEEQATARSVLEHIRRRAEELLAP